VADAGAVRRGGAGVSHDQQIALHLKSQFTQAPSGPVDPAL
jgi:hypothetical protein